MVAKIMITPDHIAIITLDVYAAKKITELTHTPKAAISQPNVYYAMEITRSITGGCTRIVFEKLQ